MKKIIGKFEQVTFPDFGIDAVVAKIDTGAYSGALHATKIREIKEGNTTILEFAPFDHPATIIKTNKYKIGHVKSSNGHTDERYYIDTTVTIHGKKYPVNITLSDRSSMKYALLLGRKFLMQNDFLVDVSIDNRYGAIKD